MLICAAMQMSQAIVDKGLDALTAVLLHLRDEFVILLARVFASL